jgi:peptidoglycan/LPS O-acetylase OafA/YrhL
MRPNIPALTGLRFIAAFSVAISHAVGSVVPMSGELPTWYVAFNNLAGIGMSLFFCLSGFVIHYNYSINIEQDPGRGIFNFFVARIARIYPLFLICLLYDLAWKYTYSQLPSTASQALPFYLTMTQAWIFQKLGDQTLIFQFGPSPQVAWSISTEWFFYCVYPVICAALTRARSVTAAVQSIVVVILIAVTLLAAAGHNAETINDFGAAHFGPGVDPNPSVISSFFGWLVYFSPYSRVLEFLLGCLCADLIVKLDGVATGTGTALTVFALLLLTAIYLLLYTFTGLLPLSPHQMSAFRMCFSLAPACALLIFCCARYDNAIVRALSAPRLVLCGEASYSLYLLHPMVVDAFRFESADSAISPWVLTGNVLRLILTLLATIGLSLVTWQIIEIPARRAIRRLLTLSGSERSDIGVSTSLLRNIRPVKIKSPEGR